MSDLASNRLPELGDRVIDKVSGFEGIVTAHSRHIAGCDRLWVEPRIAADGARREGAWVDIDLLGIIQPGAVERIVYSRRAPGGIDLPQSNRSGVL